MQDINPASCPSPEETIEISVSPAEQNKTPKRCLRFSWGLCLSSLLLLGIGFWLGSSRQTVEPISPAVAENKNFLSVEVDNLVAASSYQQSRTYTGEIVAENSSNLGFERAGKVVQLAVEAGQWVSAGTPLARLDTSQLTAQKQELLAQKQQALSQLRELQAGPRAETIDAARAKLAQERALLKEMQAGPRIQTIAAARANVNNLQEQLELARSKSQRRESLYNQGAIAREQLDEAITDVNSQQAKVKQAQSQLDELLAGTRKEVISAQQARVKQAQSQLDELLAGTRQEVIEAQQATLKQLESRLASLDIDLEKSVLKAPFSGKISQRYLDLGTAVSSGQAIVRLVQIDQVKAHIGIPASLTSQIKIGEVQSIQVGETSYRATVASFLPELDKATRTITVVLKLEDAASKTVTTGQIVNWPLQQKIPASGYWLPTTALVRGIRGLWSVYILGTVPGGFEVERRDVEILYTDGERVLVRGTLQGNEQIITKGTNRLVPGQKVRPSSSASSK
ncbi:efflux RND transporter periplasmic adaptor subunit [Calothrix sp. FACHB-1219]|uniref:efflux RND transporter periplasmic adaptor subunit n=1 Tax=unclassified Calothrix TaxID=2619626 RepID=UPI001688A9F3|nr:MULTISPECIES: efflux RND transporter periplasmic adaptor subunit [unclassified Calothrix]MBD2203714.1 efflux RND transporter periplasmic adaptor subunit [Calothrix sp. FACHB-168]MBD2222065.1 efflux RND transporter periplasmic adaptor subunit [Calothrix sp. FACHB-1219]